MSPQFTLDLPSTTGFPEASLLAAALGILLHRSSGQETIRLCFFRSRTSRTLLLDFSEDRPAGSILMQTSDQLTGAAVPASGRPHAEIHWLDPKDPLPEPDADLALAVVSEAAECHSAVLRSNATHTQVRTERMAGQLQELISAIAADPDRSIHRLPLLTRSERDWIEKVCEGGPAPRRAALAHRLFEARAGEAPIATALRYRDRTLSYGEVNARANQLAHFLSSRGIGPEARVAVCLEPSPDISIVLLAILKAGATYVPLDPSYPPARIRAILEDTRPALVLAHARLLATLPLEGAQAEALDNLDVSDFPVGNPEPTIEPGHTAYIYFTSGTTGRPKGALASYSNLSAYMQSALERYGMGPGDVMPAIARFSFSISMFELLTPLAAGATSLILDREHVLDIPRMSRTLGEVTFFHAGPSLLRRLIDQILREHTSFEAYSGVRHASSGGDFVPPEVLEGLRRIFSSAELFVIYGCSEISCMGCTYPVPCDRPVERTYVGRPFAGMSVRLVDAVLGLVPAGVIGEICFSGEGVTKGYLGQPGLASKRFIQLDGRRYYRTGDLGRLSDDGWLEIVGRSDYQVKLRGMRIELAEIEHHLRRAPGVKECVVVARDSESGEKTLIAYLVTAPEGARLQAILQHLRERLPDHMVPAAFVRLDALPLNPNMKVDRRALPDASSANRLRLESSLRSEPSTPTERKLASLWSVLLGVDVVSPDETFFDLGGDSLRAAELILRVRKDIGVTLEGIELLREPLGVLAALCDRRLGAERAPAAPAPLSSDDGIRAFRFGSGASLYGVLSKGGEPPSGRAALICQPIGEESFRTHFIVRKLVERLAARGIPSLRFDYFGSGDSAGESIEATIARWETDIREACAELRARCGAARVTAIGIRLGATLLSWVATELEIEKLVLWDPVQSGADHLAKLREMHASYLRSVRFRRNLRKPPAIRGGCQLAGFTFSDAALTELEGLSLRADGLALPVQLLKTTRAWDDIREVEKVLPDTGISRALADRVEQERK